MQPFWELPPLLGNCNPGQARFIKNRAAENAALFFYDSPSENEPDSGKVRQKVCALSGKSVFPALFSKSHFPTICKGHFHILLTSNTLPIPPIQSHGPVS